MIELKGIHHLEHIIEHLPDGVKHMFIVCFYDEKGIKQDTKTFYKLNEVINFINDDKLKKVLKDCGYMEKIFFDRKTNVVFIEYRK